MYAQNMYGNLIPQSPQYVNQVPINVQSPYGYQSPYGQVYPEQLSPLRKSLEYKSDGKKKNKSKIKHFIDSDTKYDKDIHTLKTFIKDENNKVAIVYALPDIYKDTEFIYGFDIKNTSNIISGKYIDPETLMSNKCFIKDKKENDISDTYGEITWTLTFRNKKPISTSQNIIENMLNVNILPEKIIIYVNNSKKEYTIQWSKFNRPILKENFIINSIGRKIDSNSDSLVGYYLGPDNRVYSYINDKFIGHIFDYNSYTRKEELEYINKMKNIKNIPSQEKIELKSGPKIESNFKIDSVLSDTILSIFMNLKDWDGVYMSNIMRSMVVKVNNYKPGVIIINATDQKKYNKKADNNEKGDNPFYDQIIKVMKNYDYILLKAFKVNNDINISSEFVIIYKHNKIDSIVNFEKDIPQESDYKYLPYSITLGSRIFHCYNFFINKTNYDLVKNILHNGFNTDVNNDVAFLHSYQGFDDEILGRSLDFKLKECKNNDYEYNGERQKDINFCKSHPDKCFGPYKRRFDKIFLGSNFECIKSYVDMENFDENIKIQPIYTLFKFK